MRSRQIGQILSPNRCRNQKNALKFHRPPAVVSFLADPPQAEKGGHHPVNFTRTEGPITLHQGLLCRRPETPKCWKPTGFGCVGLPAFCWSMIFESYSERGIYIYTYSIILASLKQDGGRLKSFISSNQLQLLSARCICETSQTSGDQIVTTSSSPTCLLDGLPELMAPQEPKTSCQVPKWYPMFLQSFAEPWEEKKTGWNWLKLFLTRSKRAYAHMSWIIWKPMESVSFHVLFFHPKSPGTTKSGMFCRLLNRLLHPKKLFKSCSLSSVQLDKLSMKMYLFKNFQN